MTITLKFQQGDSGTSLSMMGGSTGFQLEGDGWAPAVATPVHMGEPAPVAETIRLRLAAASHDAIATYMQSLHEMQVLADRYINDPTQEDPVWLYAQMNNETNARRALVYSIEVQYRTSWFGNLATALDIPLVLNVVRGAYWEATAARDLPQLTGLTGMVDVYDYTAAGAVVGAHDIVGDVGARIRFLEVDPTTTSQLDHLMGIRSVNKHGSTGVSNFEPVWELEDGTNGTDVTDTSDSSASGGYKIVVSESAVDWDDGDFHLVSSIYVDQITANEGDQLGTFLWLLRAAARGTTTTWEVQLRYGNFGMPESEFRPGRILAMDSVPSNWYLAEMDICKIPLSDIQAVVFDDIAASRAKLFMIKVYARRTTGTGDFDLDCLVAMPIDEGYMKIGRPEDNNTPAVIGQSPKGVWSGFVDLGSGEDVYVQPNDNNFILPPGDGRIYFITTTGLESTYEIYYYHSMTAVATANPSDSGKYYERWLSLRGSE